MGKSSATSRPGAVKRSTTLSLLLACAATPAHAAQYVLGPADSLALDQPRITFGLTNEATNPATLIGPSLYNQGLLDTGANGVLLGALSYADGENYGQPAFAFDYDGNGTIDPDEQLAQYAERGVAGTSLLNVHDKHGLRIYDSDGVERLVGTQVRAFGSDQLNLGSFAAVVGMPAMAGYAVEVDLRPMAALDFQRVAFHDTLAGADFESAQSMNVALRIIEPEFTDPTLPAELRPTFAGLPVIDHVDMINTGGANSNGATLIANDYTFLLDTGAQTVIISQQMAIDMGIDFDNSVGLGGDVVDYLEVGGIGGTVAMPLVFVDQFVMPSVNGPDLVFTDLLVGVLDIEGAPFDAVFGMNLLTTGYLEAVFGGGTSTGLVNDSVADPESFELLIEFGFVETIDDLFVNQPLLGPVLNISREDYDLLVESQILPDTNDPTEAYLAALALDDEFDTGSSIDGPIFDKVVFDFTPTNGTAVMRLDFKGVQLLGDVDYDGDVDDADFGILFSHAGQSVQPGVHALGDLDGDGDVDDADFGQAFAKFTGPGQSTLDPADLDADGDVDDADFGLAFAAFTGPGSSVNVPEPASLTLLAGAGLCLLRRRR